jgi:putative DNA primase/helicase
MTEQTVAFLRHILPANGLKCVLLVHGEQRRHHFFETIEGQADFILKRNSPRVTVYHACASFKTPANRKQVNVWEVRSFWADIDTRESKSDAPYADRGEAAKAVLEFCRTSGMPTPVFVSSGYGLHIYWPLRASLPEAIWRAYAKQLARLFETCGLKVDKSRTKDSASVLRPPGTHNRKNEQCAPVQCGELVGPYRIEDLPLSSSAQSSPDIPGSLRASRPRRRRLIDAANIKDPPAWSDVEERRICSMLACIPPAALSRDDRVHIGMALHWLGWGERGFQIFDKWLSTASEYSEWQPRRTWESFGRRSEGRLIAYGTLVHIARQHGWSDARPELHTDLGNARRLVNRHGSNIRFVPEWDKWGIWDDTHWKIDEDGAIARLAKETVDAMYHEAIKLKDEQQRTELVKHALKCRAAARLEAMVSLATTEANVIVQARLLDADPWLLGVQNGVVDLRTKQFQTARSENYITKRAGVAFNAEVACPNWREFIRTVTAGNGELAAHLQRAVGYTSTGSVREEVLFVMYGTGNNGKSTWRETIHMLMGDYAIAADAGLLIERKTPGAATPELARLKGCRLVAVNETSENDHLNEARVKFITSHDKITARNLYQGFFDFDPTHKAFLTTNHKPIVRGTDVGIWRRIHLLPFTVTIPAERVEKDFREKRLVPELSGILNWALEGLAAYQAEGLNPPPVVLSATQDYRQDMDVVRQWIDDRCEVDQQATVPTGIAYRDYVYCAQAEIGWELSGLKFRRNLTERGFAARKGTGGQRLIVGLRLKGSMPLYMAVNARPSQWR